MRIRDDAATKVALDFRSRSAMVRGETLAGSPSVQTTSNLSKGATRVSLLFALVHVMMFATQHFAHVLSVAGPIID